MKKGKKIIKLIIIALVLCLIIGIYVVSNAKPIEYRTFTVTRGDIETVVSGSGTLSASKSRKEYAKVSAEITDIYFEEGDEVKAGDVIMKLDSSSYKSNVDSQKIAIEQSKLSKQNIEKQINDLTIVSNATGYVSGLAINEGSYVTTASPVCDIVKDATYEITLQFVYNPSSQIAIGNQVTLTLMSNYATIPGTVTKVSDMRKAIEGSAQVVEVTIEATTPGYSLEGVSAKGTINTGVIVTTSVNTGKFTLLKLNTVRTKTTGTVKSLKVNEGAFVNEGDIIATLENTDLSSNLKNINLTLQNQYNQLNNTNDQLDNYEIVAKIDGIITSLPFEVGDLVSAGTMIVSVSNNEKMEFSIPVDELDVAKLNYDEKVNVSIDAIPETEFEPLQGRIKLIPLEGMTTSGITDYYVKIELDGNEDIRISMNANADIIVNSAEDALYIPIDSLITENGKKYVDVVETDESGKQVLNRKEITTGISDTAYIEVVSGLNEGEKVVIPTTSTISMPSMTSMMMRREEQ